MSVLARKVLETTILAELRAAGQHKLSKAGLRDRVSGELGPVAEASFDAAVQSLRYQGKLHWSKLELSDSMKSAGVPVRQAEEGGAAEVTREADPPSTPSPEALNSGASEEGSEAGAPSASGPDDDEGPDEDYPGEVNDRASAAHKAAQRRGVHACNTRGAMKPPPAPQHETEVMRAVREETEDAGDRRRRSRSTGTVAAPLALRRMMPPEPTIAEAIQTALASEPHDLVAIINRKHPLLWKRVIELSRAVGCRPAQALYDCLEAGLQQLETEDLRDVA